MAVPSRGQHTENLAPASRNSFLFAAARQGLAVPAIGRRHVEIQRAQQPAAGVADLVPLAALDEEQPAGREAPAAAADLRQPASLEHEEPLVGAAVAVAGP